MSILLDRAKIELHDKIAPHLNAVRTVFLPGCKITLIVRLPGHEDKDLIVTDDNIEEVDKLIQRKKARMLRGAG